MTKRYSSLAEIRADKARAKRQIADGVDRLRGDVTEHFMPSNSYFLNSSSKYMNYVGYAIAAYKAFTACRGALNFLSKLF